MTDFDLDGNITLDVDGRAKVFGILKSAKANKLRKRHRKPGGLLLFVQDFWHVLEPETPFVNGWPLEAICQHLEAVTRGEINRLLINVPPGFMKSLLCDVFWPAWEWATGRAHLRYVTFSYSSTLTERDNRRFGALVSSADFQEVYGGTVIVKKLGDKMVSNTKTGWKLASSVGGVSTGERGDRIILDDPHNVKEGESEKIRTETVRWFREAMSNRLNNMKTGAIVIIMQRVHEDDVSGAILANGLDYVHLMVPMTYDADRQIQGSEDPNPGHPWETDIGWYDPRFDEGETIDEIDGLLAWPERFDEDVCENMKRDLGPYAWCNPYEAPVLMSDLSLRPIGQVQKGDEVLGFTIGNKERRARLRKSVVLSVSVSRRPIVKITFSSGETIRCTPDHKWWTGRNDASHPPYAPAKVGSVLSRVCPAWLPDLTDPDEIRLAGWLGGFFDGEGSVSVNKRRDGKDQTLLLTFTQGDGRNKPLCDKLEYALDRFGFKWGCKIRPSRHGKSHSMRHYWLKMGEGGRTSRLPLYQRFLHIAKPSKWVDRMLDILSTGRLFTAGEKVVAIEPAGTETVYGLETTSGNYVVWGLASSNSGQYQQKPSPRGGGIFKRDWWQLWEGKDGKFPTFEYLLGSLDGAFTEDEENDPSALTIWGVFQNEEGKRRIMLVHAWRKHLAFSGPRIEMEPGESKAAWARRTQDTWGLVEWLRYTCERFHCDHLLIEAKASGISAAQELRSRYDDLDFAIQLCPVKGDKLARALACQATFSQQLVYAPDREWAEMVIDEMAVFPKGKHDDLTDSTTQAIKYLRDNGLAQTDLEANREEMERVTHDGRRQKRRRSIYGV